MLLAGLAESLLLLYIPRPYGQEGTSASRTEAVIAVPTARAGLHHPPRACLPGRRAGRVTALARGVGRPGPDVAPVCLAAQKSVWKRYGRGIRGLVRAPR